ncbi:MAG TPA: hypothetical protein VGR70_08650 [Stellaceae bacterium]|nr:hypothetical protein [Stellaceae bacterium]
MSIRRRSLPLVLAGVVAAAVGVANAAQSWDGTWAGGWENGDGVQIIIAGDKVIGVFRGGDYPDIQKSQLSGDGQTLAFAWAGGDGVLQRTGERDAAFVLHERGKPERSFVVHRE